MKRLLIFGLVLISKMVTAQIDSMFVSTEVDYEIYSTDFKTSRNKLVEYITSNKIIIINQKESKTNIDVKFKLNQDQYNKYEVFAKSLGYITSKKVKTINNFNKWKEVDLEKDFLEKRRDSYDELIKKVDDKSNNYFSLWNEKKSIEEKIFKKEVEIINLNKKENTFIVSINLKDEIISFETSEFSFINMPGVEFSYLTIENPKEGISAKTYQGYFLKYLFTKGKSYVSLGVYKALDLETNDTTAFSEMFNLGFGQDFYSRHLGHGSRKFLNLYLGYSIGGIIATSKVDKSNMLYIAPCLGLELFKSKNILIDTRANYFLPLSYNKNLRGLSLNTSINFVF